MSFLVRLISIQVAEIQSMRAHLIAPVHFLFHIRIGIAVTAAWRYRKGSGKYGWAARFGVITPVLLFMAKILLLMRSIVVIKFSCMGGYWLKWFRWLVLCCERRVRFQTDRLLGAYVVKTRMAWWALILIEASSMASRILWNGWSGVSGYTLKLETSVRSPQGVWDDQAEMAPKRFRIGMQSKAWTVKQSANPFYRGTYSIEEIVYETTREIVPNKFSENIMLINKLY